MTEDKLILILQDLKDCEHVNAMYSGLQYYLAIEYAINKIRNYHDLLNNYMTLSKSYADFKERAKHEIPLPDNY